MVTQQQKCTLVTVYKHYFVTNYIRVFQTFAPTLCDNPIPINTTTYIVYQAKTYVLITKLTTIHLDIYLIFYKLAQLH